MSSLPISLILSSPFFFFFFFNDTATTEIYTLSLHDALPILPQPRRLVGEEAERRRVRFGEAELAEGDHLREHFLGDALRHSAGRRPGAELLPKARHQLAAAPAAHGAAQRFGLPRREARERLAHLH